MSKLKEFFSLLKETGSEWKEDNASRLAAALAYYTIFSLAPLLLLVISLVGFITSKHTIEGEIYGQIADLVGQESANSIRDIVENVNQAGGGTFATIVGLVTLIFGATGVFGQLQGSLNTIWDVKPKPGGGLVGMIRARLLSFAMVPAIGFLLLVSLVVDAILAAGSNYLQDLFPSQVYVTVLQIVSLVVSIGVITALFMLIYRVLPDAQIAWSDVWIGAFATALLFTIGRVAIGLYLGHSSTASAYGAAGSLIVILLWIYYSAQLLFLGAEFTQVYARRYGSGITPAGYAMRLDMQDRVEQGTVSSEARPATFPVQSQPGTAPQGGAWRSIGESDQQLKPSHGRTFRLLSFVLGAAAGSISMYVVKGKRKTPKRNNRGEPS